MAEPKLSYDLIQLLFCLSTFLFLLSCRAEEHVTEIPAGKEKTHGGEAHGNSSHEGTGERYQIARLDWAQVRTPYTISLWILLASVAKIGFHLSKKFASIFPDSSLLIVLGLLVGLILFFVRTDESQYHLPSNIFFLYLLPPIVFDAGYFMPNRPFFDNLGSILVYAVIGTIWNTMTIGLSLYAVSLTKIFNWETPLLHSLTFSALISAVDPVAVLVVFEEIQVNAMLYITVFGESLLNDAVTVVLYEMFEVFAKIGEKNLKAVDVISGFIAFFVVSLGGVLIGIIWALVCSFTTKFTKHVRVIEPQIILLMAYIAYLTAQMFHLSAILAIVFCGIFMKQYVEENISVKSKTTVQYLLKMICTSCETIIFMFLGLSTVTKEHGWDTAFVALTVLFCLVYRAIGVVILTFFVNKKRLIKLNKVDQFIMAYGGLRGAIAYGLVSALDEDHIPAKKMFVTTTIVVIYFTVFLQGMTIKPLVNFLKVKKEEHIEPTMCAQIFGRNIDHLVGGVETVIGAKGHHWRRIKFEYINERYIKPLLLRDLPMEKDTSITKVFTELNMKAAMDHVEKFGTFHSDLNMATQNNVNHMVDYPAGRSNGSAMAYTNQAFSHSTEDLDGSPGEVLKEKLNIRRYSRDISNEMSPEVPKRVVSNKKRRRFSSAVSIEDPKAHLENGAIPEAHSAVQARRRSIMSQESVTERTPRDQEPEPISEEDEDENYRYISFQTPARIQNGMTDDDNSARPSSGIRPSNSGTLENNAPEAPESSSVFLDIPDSEPGTARDLSPPPAYASIIRVNDGNDESAEASHRSDRPSSDERNQSSRVSHL